MGGGTMCQGAFNVRKERVSSWEDLVRHMDPIPRRLFRGQSSAGWELETTLERACNRIDRDLGRADAREKALLREFKRRYHHHSTDAPHDDDDLEWLSLMQHHGAPTRLLDWTYSLPIAAFFAVRSANPREPAIVWCMDEDWCRHESRLAMRRVGEDADYVTGPVEGFPKTAFRAVFMDPPAIWDGVAIVNPFRLNLRLAQQQGVFTAPGNVRKSYMDNLVSLSGWNDKVEKLVISPDAFKPILSHLTRHNVTNASLFPDLDGFAEGLGIFHPELWR